MTHSQQLLGRRRIRKPAGSVAATFCKKNHRDLSVLFRLTSVPEFSVLEAPKNQLLLSDPSVGKLLLYMGPVKRQAQYIVLYFQMLRRTLKLLYLPCFTGFSSQCFGCSYMVHPLVTLVQFRHQFLKLHFVSGLRAQKQLRPAGSKSAGAAHFAFGQ
jgi:hypothetical protein